ncbi:MAG: contact-dependent growth inhibition system immunity protein [Lysobacterales bacterium]
MLRRQRPTRLHLRSARHRLTLTDAAGEVTQYGYDAANRVTSVSAPGVGATTYAYDRASQLRGRTGQGGLVTDYGYDDAGRIASITHLIGSTPTLSIGYTHNANGNRIQQVIEHAGSAAETTDFEYDAADRLVRSHDGQSDTRWTLDAAGNRTLEEVREGGVLTRRTAYTVDVRDRLRSATPGRALATGEVTEGTSGRLVLRPNNFDVEIANDLADFERGAARRGAGPRGIEVIHENVAIPYGAGIRKQGYAWEDYRAGQQSRENRLLPNTETFDFFDADTRTATSAKTLDTSTPSRMRTPSRVAISLRRYLDDIANVREIELPDGSLLRGSDIDRRVMDLPIPRSTTRQQWLELHRVHEDARSNNIELGLSTTGPTAMKFDLNRQSASASFYGDFFYIVTLSGFGRVVPDPEGASGFLPPGASDQELGELTGRCLAMSRVLDTRDKRGDLFDADRLKTASTKWETEVMAIYGYKSSSAIYRWRRSVGVECEHGRIELTPRFNDRGKRFTGEGIDKSQHILLPVDIDAARLGAWLREAFRRCRGSGADVPTAPLPRL